LPPHAEKKHKYSRVYINTVIPCDVGFWKVLRRSSGSVDLLEVTHLLEPSTVNQKSLCSRSFLHEREYVCFGTTSIMQGNAQMHWWCSK
jgi:hypothetical protein